MSFTIKIRGGSGLLAVEYLCPAHGRFDMTVEREANGDPPATQPCPATSCGACPDCELGDVCGVQRGPCGAIAEHVISAPKPRVLTVPVSAAVRGGDLKDRPPGMLDTRPLAEGQKYSEWKKDQAKLSASRRYDELVKKGLATKRIQVG